MNKNVLSGLVVSFVITLLAFATGIEARGEKVDAAIVNVSVVDVRRGALACTRERSSMARENTWCRG